MKEKILVIAPQFLGDGILSVPFFRNLRLGFKDAQIDAITKNAGKLILSKVPYIDNVYDLKNITKKFIREQKYTKVYLLKRSFSALALVLGCGIKQKIGFSGQFRKPFLTKPVKYETNKKHERDCFLDVLIADRVDIIDDSLEYFVQQEAQDAIQKHLTSSKKALIVAKASTTVKEWKKEHFIEVINWLKTKGFDIYFIGLESEKDYYDSLGIDEKTHNLCGQLSMDECTAIVKNMDLVFGIDSGFCHMATAFGVPTATLFGPMSTTQWGLLGENSANITAKLACSPCQKPRKCKKNIECLKAITPELVEKEISKLPIKI
jgi:heptosyltransferase-2